jgi:hypothetical protein
MNQFGLSSAGIAGGAYFTDRAVAASGAAELATVKNDLQV